MAATNEARWVWIDLEMTGLAPKRDCIIQIATIITDAGMNEIDHLDLVVWQPESALETMGPFVRKMHTDNGLLNRVRGSDLSCKDAERITMEMICRHVPYKKGVLAGNTIWQDRRFLEAYMPSLEDYLHYRQIDVSTLKILSQEWYGAKGTAPAKTASHTALEDIRASIEELKFYQAHCMGLKDDGAPNA